VMNLLSGNITGTSFFSEFTQKRRRLIRTRRSILGCIPACFRCKCSFDDLKFESMTRSGSNEENTTYRLQLWQLLLHIICSRGVLVSSAVHLKYERASGVINPFDFGVAQDGSRWS